MIFLKFLFKKIVYTIMIFIFICVIIFLMLKIMPNDPVDIILGFKAPLENKTALRKEMGLDLSIYQQLKNYLWNIFTKFDFGNSYFGNKESAVSLFQKKFVQTLKLSFFGILLGSLIGIFFGIQSALNREHKIDYFLLFVSVILTSLPSFVICFLLQYFFGVYLEILPLTGFSTFREMILPIFAIALIRSGNIFKVTRINMIKVLEKPYIITAYAKGLRSETIIYKNALKNAAVPIISNISLNFGFLIGGSIITEKIFNIYGIGHLIIDSFQQKDLLVMACCVSLLSLFLILVNFILEVVCYFLNPKLKF